MSQRTVEIERAASLGPATGNVDQCRVYHRYPAASRASMLSLVADVLLVLQFPLSARERSVFNCLLRRRLQRVYGGTH